MGQSAGIDEFVIKHNFLAPNRQRHPKVFVKTSFSQLTHSIDTFRSEKTTGPLALWHAVERLQAGYALGIAYGQIVYQLDVSNLPSHEGYQTHAHGWTV